MEKQGRKLRIKSKKENTRKKCFKREETNNGRLKDFHWLYERNKKWEIEEKRRRKKKKRKLHTDNDQPSSH